MSFSRSIPCLTAIVLVVFLFAGCKKDEGPGGTSTIKGKVIVHDFDPAYQNSVPVIYSATDEDTYIIYGADHSTYDDDYKTSFDGSYEFKFLQKGHYRLFAYSKDSTGAHTGNLPSLKIPVFVDVEITSNGSTVTAPDIIILNNKQ
jgi:hypothetical protein